MADINAGNIRGRPVIDNRGTNVGTVEDVMVDADSWRVKSLLVTLRREIADDLRVDRPMMGAARLNVAPERVQSVGDNVILNLDTDALAGLLRSQKE